VCSRDFPQCVFILLKHFGSEGGSKTNFEPVTNKCQIDALLEKEQQHTQFAKTSSKRLTTSIGRIPGLISSSNTGQI
jgi:hypothetical protein